jgi:hypothetical protein
MLPPQSPGGWPARAIQDTVDAIIVAGGKVYRRDVGQSILDRVLDMLGRIVREIFEFARGIPNGRLLAQIAGAIIVILIILRIIFASRLRDEARIRIGRGRAGGSADAWAEAQALAAAGDHTSAAHALYAAVIERLAAREGLRLHRSRTSGDYARELRRRGSPSHAAFRAFSRRYDRIIYGDGTCSAGEYAALLQLVQHLMLTARAA